MMRMCDDSLTVLMARWNTTPLLPVNNPEINMEMKGGLGDLMKQAQEMQDKVKSMQAELANAEVHGESGAGLVKITMTGRYDVKQVEIDDSLLTEDKEILEDLIGAAVNDAVRRVEKNQKDKMSSLTAGIPLPPGFKFPFS